MNYTPWYMLPLHDFTIPWYHQPVIKTVKYPSTTK